ncbi:type VI secretion system contractile sheath protein TssC, partial [Bergeyella sp. RCAD1439]|nr:type VI secretion system contractile sheath protein TssC [Bergeyella sp. RCAD1439]
MAENKQSQIKETQSVQREQVSIEKSLDQLARYGGFDLLETSIENIQNLNPDRKARRKIFLSEKNKAKERQTLKKTLELWADVISKSDTLTDMVAHCE